MFSIQIANGFHVPFYPMRPTPGRDLRTRRSVESLWSEIQDETLWVAQPKLDGDRAVLTVHERRVYLHNRHGGIYRLKVENAAEFLHLPDDTCFDGEVFKRNFYPFEILALKGRSFLEATTIERVALAKHFAEHLKQPWMFPEMSLDWLVRRGENLPNYQGVVLKRSNALYRLLGAPSQTSLDWFKRCWS